MAVTIAGAVRQKKMYPGKQVRISTDKPQESPAQIVEIDTELVTVKLIAPTQAAQKVWQVGDLVSVSFVVPEDAAYCFSARVVKLQGEMSMQLKQMTPLKRMEQRNHFRLKTSKLIYVLAQKDDDGVEDWKEAGLLDISRGGASILMPLKVGTGSLIRAWIPLDEVDHVLETDAKVMRLVEGNEGQLTIGVSFVDLPLVDQEKILDYILKVWTEKKSGAKSE